MGRIEKKILIGTAKLAKAAKVAVKAQVKAESSAKAAKAVAKKVADTFTQVQKSAVQLNPAVKAASADPNAGVLGSSHLTQAEKDILQKAQTGALGANAKRNYDSLTGLAQFKSLPVESQARILKSFATNPSATIFTGQLTDITRSANFAKLSASEKAQLLDVFDRTSVSGRASLVTLLNRNVNGKPALLDKDAKGGTMLKSLHGIATGTLDGRFASNGVTREALLASVMQEAGQPGQINQSNRGTCTVTSMQYLLCDTNPAEYVRLMQGLLSPEGKVKMRNGDTLTRVGDSIAPDSATDRSASERVFQSAMMDYANGSENYSNVTDKSTLKILGIKVSDHSGLSKGPQEKGLQALFGRNFKVYTGSWNFKDDAQDILNKLKERSPTDTFIGMKWGKDKKGGHAVVCTRVENGRVYFRNPWGPTSDPVGTTYSDPPRRLENGATREESMSEADFKKWIKHCVY